MSRYQKIVEWNWDPFFVCLGFSGILFLLAEIILLFQYFILKLTHDISIVVGLHIFSLGLLVVGFLLSRITASIEWKKIQ